MTLILNEITMLNGLSNAYWICAADRRITLNGKFVSNRQKIFPIKYLNATVSFFGLAIWTKGDRKYFLSEIIKQFITKNSDLQSLDAFATKLNKELNSIVPKNLLKKYPTGIHFSGYNENGYPHFLHFSNVGRMEQNKYLDLQDSFKKPFADFMDRDVTEVFKWDKKNPLSIRNGRQLYRNGDIATHVASSDIFDVMMKQIFDLPDFKKIKNHKQHAEYIKFKFDFIARLYETWANHKIIGKPIDIYVLTPKDMLYLKGDSWITL